LFPETALVTGAAGGIGRAIVARLERDGTDVQAVDLVDGFDVTDSVSWESVRRVDLACLNAGVVADTAKIADLTDEEYRRVVSVNVDGVVWGVRRLARVMGDGDVIVVTASLAGLTGVEGDPIYASHRSSPSAASGSTRSARASPTLRWSRGSFGRHSSQPASRCWNPTTSPKPCSLPRAAKAPAKRG
jgi:NAD(P)-dependent dehydrogenase (short-subunit alcohol dehydrogenase family)